MLRCVINVGAIEPANSNSNSNDTGEQISTLFRLTNKFEDEVRAGSVPCGRKICPAVFSWLWVGGKCRSALLTADSAVVLLPLAAISLALWRRFITRCLSRQRM